MEFVTTNYSSMTLHEGLNDIPRVILRLNDSRQYGYPGGIQEVEVEGYKGFVDKIVGRDIYIKLIDPKVFQTFESKYLGNTLRNAINSLTIKPNISGTFEDISQEFHMIRETPWHAFIRLSRYLPKEYYMVCLGNEVKIFKTPDIGSFKEINISDYRTEADYSIEYDNLIIDMSKDSEKGNPSYGGLISVPLSNMLKEDIVTDKGTDVVNNYLIHYKNRDSYFSENLLFQSIDPNINIGQGLKIDGTNFMVISKSITIGSTGTTNGAYRCIKVS